jgi:hypothetical protein
MSQATQDRVQTTHPIEARVPAVFVSVSDFHKSLEWYCWMLGLPVPAKANGFYILPMSKSGANIILERTDEVRPSPHVLFSLPAKNLKATEAFLKQRDVKIVSRDGDSFNFQDPDGHVLMACSI